MRDCSVVRLFDRLFAAGVFLCAAAAPSPSCAAPSEAMRIFGEIQLTNRVMNLRNAAWLEKSYAAALKAVTDANEKAQIAWAYAKFKYDFAQDDDFAKWRQAQRDAYATPGADAMTRLMLLKQGVAGLDYERDGWKLVENESVRLQEAYFWELVFRTRLGAVGIDEANSAEHRLAVCEKAIARLGENARGGYFVVSKADALVRLGRADEAEKALLAHEKAVANDPRLRYEACRALGDFYRVRAKRYYAARDVGLLQKALACDLAALAEMRKFDERPNGYISPIETALELKDEAKAEALLAGYRACCEKRKLPFPDMSYAQWAGDLAYFRGDYAKAVEHYSSVKELPRPRAAESHYNRYLGALYALGRYDEALKVVPKLVAWCSLADRNELYRRILNKKIESAKKEGGQR